MKAETFAVDDQRRRVRPLAVNDLRMRAWWVMRQVGKFTLNDLLDTLASEDDKNSRQSLHIYIKALEDAGILGRLKRKVFANSPFSRGQLIWRVVHDLGRHAPVLCGRRTMVFDPNSGTMLSVARQKGRLEADDGEEGAADASAIVKRARKAVVQSVRQLQRENRWKIRSAVEEFLKRAHAGLLDDALLAHLKASLAPDGRGRKGRLGASGIPSSRSIVRWMTLDDFSLRQAQPDMRIMPWMLTALRIKRGLQNPKTSEVHKRLCRIWRAEWGKPISYAALNRFLGARAYRMGLDSDPVSVAANSHRADDACVKPLEVLP